MATYAQWYLIQYTRDIRRREPRNIGIAVTDGETWVTRIVAFHNSSGRVDGKSVRSLGIAKDDYEPWVRYLAHSIEHAEIEAVMQRQRHRPTEFRVIPGGRTEMHAPVNVVADVLFEELVQITGGKEAGDNWARQLQKSVETTLQIAKVPVEAEPAVSAAWGATRDVVRFDYSYTNGRVHLMDRVQLHRKSVEEAKKVARDFGARATAVREAGAANDFVAFYSQRAVDDLGTDIVLAPLWKVARTVNVDVPDRAASELVHLVGRG